MLLSHGYFFGDIKEMSLTKKSLTLLCVANFVFVDYIILWFVFLLNNAIGTVGLFTY